MSAKSEYSTIQGPLVKGKVSKERDEAPAKQLKDLRAIISELPKLGKDAERFLKDSLPERANAYHYLDHLAGTWDKEDISEFDKNH